ncbi:hypothetical protein LVJ85_05625 [Neisseria sp. Dent CA1/247]|uniref:hypothetical protein n=1 Tax=Neisseria sp. Dent CA1/247 TaxID=2912675 RepID=UPI001FD4D60E|nr:hypothetical protein [Neisseria sp. Dent CA1/247]UOO77941.1 hypothetical protein LVJ85_05625 [Neisseria sp. Dent CA1/247]
MERLALSLKVGQHVILPSGNAAEVVEIGKDTVRFKYLCGGGVVELSRALCCKYWGA